MGVAVILHHPAVTVYIRATPKISGKHQKRGRYNMDYIQGLHELYAVERDNGKDPNLIIISEVLYSMLEGEVARSGFVSAPNPEKRVKYNELFGMKLLVVEDLIDPMFMNEVPNE